MIDLHTHSSASDGTYAPAELMRKASGLGISAIALTDHDCLDGLAEAGAAAAELGIRFIQGVELEIAFGPGEFHLLGLNLQIGASGPSEELKQALAELAAARHHRNRQMLQLIAELGHPVSYDEVQSMYGVGIIGRPHIAEYLVSKGVVKNKQRAFDEYLAKGRPYYIQKECMELERAVRLIHQAGGLAFIAHPMSLFVSWTRLRKLLPEWQELGVDGLEAWHPLARLVDCNRLETVAKELGLRVCAGSDYHGPIRPDRQLGRTAGKRIIEDRFLAALEP